MLQKICRTLFLTTLFLLPLKFGTMLLPGVPHTLPADIYSIVLNALPPSIFPLWSGFLLLLAVAGYGFKLQQLRSTTAGRIVILFLLLPLISLLGFINPDNLESAVIELEYLLGVGSFALLAWIIITGEGPEFRNRMMNTLVLSAICTALAGVYQYFWGFSDLKNFIEEQEKLHKIEFPKEIKARAYDVRTYATFTFASALAGFLALTGALTAVKAYRAGNSVEPVKISQKLFTLLAVLLCGGIFLTTKGRSAFLAVIISAAVCGFLMLKNRKLKLFLAIGAALVIIAGACYIHHAGRGFGSMTERVGYLQSSAKMLIQHPLCGGGWGSFTFFHAQHKNFGNEELAKDPHNIIAAFASQTGIAGGLLITFLMLYVLYIAGKNLKKEFSLEALAIFFGLLAFSLHMLMDLDWQVPALMACYTLFALFACENKKIDFNDENKKSSKAAYLLPLFFAIITACGGMHWAAADEYFGKMLAASGQVAGIFSQPASSYEVDAAAGKALKAAPWSHSIYNAWALDKLRRGDLLQAEKLFKKTIEMAPRFHGAHKSLSKVYKLQGKHELAQKYAEKADSLFPYYKIFFKNRGMKDE